MMLNGDQVEQAENRYRDAVLKLSDDKRKEFYSLSTKRIKDPDTYATLNWFFIAGLHHFYLGQWVRGLANIALIIVGFSLLFTDATTLGVLMLLAIVAAEFWELFRSQIIIKDFNNKVTKQILTELDVNLNS